MGEQKAIGTFTATKDIAATSQREAIKTMRYVVRTILGDDNGDYIDWCTAPDWWLFD